jgi:hypothetical protein
VTGRAKFLRPDFPRLPVDALFGRSHSDGEGAVGERLKETLFVAILSRAQVIALAARTMGSFFVQQVDRLLARGKGRASEPWAVLGSYFRKTLKELRSVGFRSAPAEAKFFAPREPLPYWCVFALQDGPHPSPPSPQGPSWSPGEITPGLFDFEPAASKPSHLPSAMARELPPALRTQLSGTGWQSGGSSRTTPRTLRRPSARRPSPFSARLVLGFTKSGRLSCANAC